MKPAPTALAYRAPWWLPGGHAQTIWPALAVRRRGSQPATGSPTYQRERWTTPDGDFIDLDWQRQRDARTLLVLFHGLEGSSASHYARDFAGFAAQRGFDFVVPHFRGCSGEPNRAPRAYHSGDFQEIDWILRRLRQHHPGRVLAVGVSLGGNALLRWAEEMGAQAAQVVDALAAVSAPVDLTASGLAMGRGLNRQVYTRMFLASMKPKALAQHARFPGLFDAQALRDARTLHDFDEVFTAPLHGFSSARDYWQRASAKPLLAQIRVPTLLLNARNDPFVPGASLPQAQEVGAYVSLWQPAQGGHVGFPPQGANAAQLSAVAVGSWLAQQGDEHG